MERIINNQRLLIMKTSHDLISDVLRVVWKCKQTSSVETQKSPCKNRTVHTQDKQCNK